MTVPDAPQPGENAGYAIDTAPVQPVTMALPLVPFAIEKRRSSAVGLLLGFAVVVAIGGVAFAAGRLSAPATASTAGVGAGRGGNGTGFGGGTGVGPGASGAPGGASFGGGVLAGAKLSLQGTVESISPTAMGLKVASGATVVIPIEATTTYHGQSAATAGNVTTGAHVLVEVTGGFGGRGAGQGGANASAPPPVGAAGGTGASPAGGSGAPVAGPGGAAGGIGATFGPAVDITLVAP